MDGLVGIAGDFNPKDQTHMATNRALQDIGFRFEWVPTTDLERKSPKRLAPIVAYGLHLPVLTAA